MGTNLPRNTPVVTNSTLPARQAELVQLFEDNNDASFYYREKNFVPNDGKAPLTNNELRKITEYSRQLPPGFTSNGQFVFFSNKREKGIYLNAYQKTGENPNCKELDIHGYWVDGTFNLKGIEDSYSLEKQLSRSGNPKTCTYHSVDLLGTGGSFLPENYDGSPEQDATALEAYFRLNMLPEEFNDLNIIERRVVGHSRGGPVTAYLIYQLYTNYPNLNLSEVTLMSPWFVRSFMDVLLKNAPKNATNPNGKTTLNSISLAGVPSRRRLFKTQEGFDKMAAQNHRRWKKEGNLVPNLSARPDMKEFHAFLKSTLDPNDKVMERIRNTPGMVIAGEKDWLIDFANSLYAALWLDKDVILVTNGSHLLPVTFSEDVARIRKGLEPKDAKIVRIPKENLIFFAARYYYGKQNISKDAIMRFKQKAKTNREILLALIEKYPDPSKLDRISPTKLGRLISYYQETHSMADNSRPLSSR